MMARIYLTLLVLFATGRVATAKPSLTIYNQDFAVVRQALDLDLTTGINEVRVTDVTAHLEPDSVILRDPSGQRDLRILEQNYRGDPVSQGLLLSLYEGKEIDFLVTDHDGRSSTVRGRIIRSGYSLGRPEEPRYYDPGLLLLTDALGSEKADDQSLIEVDGRLQFGLPGKPLFPALGDDTVLKPTLHWVLQTSRAGRFQAELGYVTTGMRWEADYNLLSPSEGDDVDVIGWITMENRTGKTFEDAQIKLMAGDVSKIRPEPLGMMGGMGGIYAPAASEAVTEKAFEEYHLYTLARPTTLHDRETKQVEFLRAEGVQAQRFYVYDGATNVSSRAPERLRQQANYGTRSDSKVAVMREFENAETNHLGMPLPRGRMRFYRQDDDGQLEFVGEDTIDHTPRDETVRVRIGNAFDLVGERTQTDYQIDTSRRTLDESFEIKLRNRKEGGSVEIRVVEHLYRWPNWDIVEHSHDFKKIDSRTIEFRIRVPADQEKTLKYDVHYTW